MHREAIITLVLLAPACGDVPGSPLALGPDATRAALQRADVRAEREALLAADRAYEEASATLGVADGFVPMLTVDAVLLSHRQPFIVGRDAIAAHLAAQPNAATTRVSWTTARGDVSRAGDVGYTFGWRTQQATLADGSTQVIHGKFISFWRKDEGAWRVSAHLLLQHVLEPPAAPEPPELHDWVDAGVRGAPTSYGASVDELFATDLAFSDLSAASGTEVAFGTYAAYYAVTVGPITPIVVGRKAIAEANRQAPGAPSLTWEPRGGEIAASGDLGYTVGFYTVHAPTPFHGKYFTIWERQASGDWRFILDGGAAIVGAPPATGL